MKPWFDCQSLQMVKAYDNKTALLKCALKCNMDLTWWPLNKGGATVEYRL